MTAAITVLLAAAAAWYVLAPLWRRGVPPERARSTEQARLLEARETALRTLRDLALDHATGKMSDADYDTLRTRHEAAAIEALRRLDAIGVPRPDGGAAGASSRAPD